MSRRVVLAVLTALTLGLTAACGSTVAGVATPGAGATGVPGTADAPSLPSGDDTPGSTGEEPTSDAPTTGEETSTGEETTADEPTTGDDTTSGGDQTGSDTTTGGSGDTSSCEAFTNLAQGFAELLQKVSGGEKITQEEVDAVFTEQARASLPASLGDTFDKLKSLSDKLVGKSLTELGDVATELQSASQLLQDGLKQACDVG